MTTMIAHVAGDWTAQRTPQLLVDYPHPAIISCDDITGEYPVTSPGVWEIRADSAVIATISTDTRYLVLWSEEEVTDGPQI